MNATPNDALLVWLTALGVWWMFINALINNRLTNDTDEINKRLLELAKRLAVGDIKSYPAKWSSNIDSVRLKFVPDPDRVIALQLSRMLVYGFLLGAFGLLVVAAALAQQGAQPGTNCEKAINWLSISTIVCSSIVGVYAVIIAMFFDGPHALCDLFKPNVK